MKRLFLFVLLGVAGLPLAALATDPYWINIGNVTAAPQIDAFNFVNESGATINIFTFHPFEPFETSNTRNFTNKGSMTSIIGWGFNNVSSGTGVRRMASSFHNYPQGTVTAVDGGVYTIIGPGNVIEAPSKLFVSATNIINEGLLTVGSQGFMNLEGKQVNLNRAGLQVQPFFGRGITLVLPNPPDFIPDVALIDNYWGVFTNNINSQNILTVVGGNATVTSPNHTVQLPGGGTLLTRLGPFAANSFVYTNTDVPVTIIVTNATGGRSNVFVSTNMTLQAAFVGMSGSSVGVNATFYPSTITTNLFSTVTVELSTSIPNLVTGGSDTLALYLMDQLASETNRNLSANLSVTPTTYRPGCYQVSRLAPFEYVAGAPPNSTVTSGMLFDPLTMSNRTVGAVQAAYSVTADTVPGRVAGVPGGSISNMPGRLTISAETLDLTRTRLRSDSWVSVKASHLAGSSNAVVDAFLLSYDLGSTNGSLRIQNLAKQTVDRFGGVISCWSGVWTNTMQFVLTNFSEVITNDPGDTNVPPASITNYVPANITNYITIGFHALILDATTLAAQVTVYTHDFVTRSTNVILNDPLFVTNSFFTDSQRFTIEGANAQLTFGVGLQDWEVVNAPNLLYLTNSAAFSVPDQAHFGDDRPLPYAAFVNKGSLSAGGISVRSDYFENGGSMNANSLLFLQTVSGKMENADTFVGGDLRIWARDFKFRNYSHQSQGALVFTITNSLSDNGPGANAQLLCDSGFHVTFANATGKPQVGDLLGTTFDTFIPIFKSIPHSWPGDDRGVSASGFTNNLALGRLVITVDFEAQAVFDGTGVSNAMYVDFLDIEGVTLDDLDAAISIGPNMVIYFADSNLPAEELDGRLGGRLRWVSSFAGPNSSVDVVLPNGQVIQMNRALRESLIIDSDGDGLANGYDPSPLDPSTTSLSVSVASASPFALSLSWNAKAQTVYNVEFKTNQVSPWQLLKHYTNNAATTGKVTIQDQVTPGSPQRYYRISYSP